MTVYKFRSDWETKEKENNALILLDKYILVREKKRRAV